jgi:malate synthase
MTDRTACGGLQVASELYRFINEEAIPGTGIDASKFWAGVDALIHELTPVNRELVAKRDVIQGKIDAFHKARRGQAHDASEYKAFLEEIGYLLPEPQNVSVSTDNVDPEVATTAGPQLVVPVMNARYALNAANARWGSLYNALYGTDAIASEGGAEAGSSYNPVRGNKVIAFAKQFLDDSAPLASGSHSEVIGYATDGGKLVATTASGTTGLQNNDQLVGYTGDASAPTAIVLVHFGLNF